MKTAIVDIDGTISDSRHRLHFVRPPDGTKKDYEAFHSRCGEDPVIESMKLVLQTLCDGARIMLVTGRPRIYREETLDWLDDNNIPYDQLHMRPVGDKRPAPEFKKDILDLLRSKGHDVFLAIEDQASVVAMWRANGVHCLQTEAL